MTCQLIDSRGLAGNGPLENPENLRPARPEGVEVAEALAGEALLAEDGLQILKTSDQQGLEL